MCGTGTIMNSCNHKSGSVYGGRCIGGIAGGTNTENSKIMNCYNEGEITCFMKGAGGIAGYCSSIDMRNCFNIGNLLDKSANGIYIGGIIAKLDGEEEEIENCYYLEDCAEHACGSDTDYSMDTKMKKSETDMKSLATDLGDAFVNTDDDYPKLKWEVEEKK